MKMRIAVLALAAALAATAQTPASRQPSWCGFKAPDRPLPKAGVLEPDQFAIPRGDLCEHYTYGAGWDEQMVLQLGEGAEEYREWIEMAVDVWNDALWGRESSVHPIRISNERPTNYRIPPSFWEDYEADDKVTLDQEDDENVIYFTPSADYARLAGLATVWTTSSFFGKSGGNIVEADVYINTELDEGYGAHAALIVPLLRYSHDNDHGVYIYVHDAFLTILHEIGHALGLSHIPIAGNIMSYSRWEGLIDQWEDSMALHMYMLHTYSLGVETIGHDFFVDRHDHNNLQGRHWMPIKDDRTRILTDFYTSKLRLGEMEKMLLACSYEF